MKHLLARITFISLLSLGLVQNTGAGPIPSSEGLGKQTLTVTQNVGDNNLSAISANVAPLVNSNKGFGNTVSVIPVAVPLNVASLPAVPVVPGMRESDIMTLAQAHFKANGPGLANRMGSWMRQKGLAFGWYTYTQKVMVGVSKSAGASAASGSFTGSGGGSGGGGSAYVQYQKLLSSPVDTDGSGSTNPSPNASALMATTEERLLVWTMNTDQNGRLLFGNPLIVQPRPKTLYVVYTPLRLEKGLPDGWKYPNAGTIFVQTRDENYVPIPGTDERIDVGGAFDEPAEPLSDSMDTATTYSAAQVIACFMDHRNAGCSNSMSVRRLMDDRGASMAVVEYIHKVQPVYDENSGGTLVPRGKLEITKREIQFDGCADVKYYNEGTYLFELKSIATRYLVTSSGNFGVIDEATTSEISPTVNYTGTLIVQSTDLQYLPGYVINPVDPTNPKMLAVADITAQIVAPVTKIGNPKGTLYYNTSGYIRTGSNHLSAHVYVGCDMSRGTLAVSAGWQDVGTNVATNWTPAVNAYSVGTEFLKGVPGGGGIATRESTSNGYCSGYVSYDGNRQISLNMSAGCEWGNDLIGGNIMYADGFTPSYANDGLGSLFPQYCTIGNRGGAGGVSPFPRAGGKMELVGNSRWGCVYNYSSGLNMSIDSILSGGENPCDSVEHSSLYFDQISTLPPVTGGTGTTGATGVPDSSGSSGATGGPTTTTPAPVPVITYGGKACVANSTPTWSLSW